MSQGCLKVVLKLCKGCPTVVSKLSKNCPRMVSKLFQVVLEGCPCSSQMGQNFVICPCSFQVVQSGSFFPNWSPSNAQINPDRYKMWPQEVLSEGSRQIRPRQVGPWQIGPLANLVANWAPHFLLPWQIGPLVRQIGSRQIGPLTNSAHLDKVPDF